MNEISSNYKEHRKNDGLFTQKAFRNNTIVLESDKQILIRKTPIELIIKSC